MPQRKRTRAKKATSNAQVNSLVKAVKQLKVTKKKTPFRDTGGIVGNRIGGMFGNANMGRGIGRWLGSGIGSIFGSGDYTMVGSSPSYNVMTNGAQIPKFDTSRQTNVVCHREYLGDILGTAAFNLSSYPINPGMSQTFPWLSTVASSYQEYKFHGLVFEFRSLVTDFVTGGAPGAIVMATNYNADAPTYVSKQQMENSEFAVATKPTVNLMHGVECADNQTILPQRFIRNGSVPVGQDLRLYDMGKFQLATVTNPVQNLGELWVSYCVELFKPILPDSSPVPGVGFHTNRAFVSSANPLGTVQIFAVGGLDVTASLSTLTIRSADPGTKYLVTFNWYGTASVFAAPGFTFTGCVALPYFQNGAANSIVSPQLGLLSSSDTISFVLQCTNVVEGPISLAMNGAGTYAGSAIDVFVTQLDPDIIS